MAFPLFTFFNRKGLWLFASPILLPGIILFFSLRYLFHLASLLHVILISFDMIFKLTICADRIELCSCCLWLNTNYKNTKNQTWLSAYSCTFALLVHIVIIAKYHLLSWYYLLIVLLFHHNTTKMFAANLYKQWLIWPNCCTLCRICFSSVCDAFRGIYHFARLQLIKLFSYTKKSRSSHDCD